METYRGYKDRISVEIVSGELNSMETWQVETKKVWGQGVSGELNSMETTHCGLLSNQRVQPCFRRT